MTFEVSSSEIITNHCSTLAPFLIWLPSKTKNFGAGFFLDTGTRGRIKYIQVQNTSTRRKSKLNQTPGTFTMAAYTPSTSSNSNSTPFVGCTFRNVGEAAAAVAELRSLTQVPSLVGLQRAQLVKQMELRPPQEPMMAPAVNQMDLHAAIAFVLDVMDDDDFQDF